MIFGLHLLHQQLENTFTKESYTYYRRYSEQVTRNVQKNYTSITDRLNKKDSYLLHAQNVLNYCTTFKSVDNLDQRNHRNFKYYNRTLFKLQKRFFNFEIYKCLKKYKMNFLQ